MIHLPPELTELRDLLDALCEETITADQVRRLEELVLADPRAEAYYVQYMSLYADLTRHFVALPDTTAESLRDRVAEARTAAGRGEAARQGDRRAARPRYRSRLLLAGGALAALAAALLMVLALPRPHEPDVAGSAEGAEPVDSSVAVLLPAPGAKWGETELPTHSGALLPPGRLRLKSGFAQIEFYSGATVILEGPADFRLISPREAYCAAGKLRVSVPPQAHGFTIGSPQFDLVDRGTEFGLSVRGAGPTEVHVFQGKVELYDAGSGRSAPARRELTTGRGLRLDGSGAARPIAPDPAAFLTAEGLAARSAREMSRRQEAWLAASRDLRRDPSLLVYYPFHGEPAWGRTLLDQAAGRRQPRDGAVVGCQWGDGRWPGKRGLEFKRASDRVRFHVPGEHDALTLMAWVRVDALPNRFNSLMMTDGWEDAAPHWHISAAGELELGVQGRNHKGGAHYYTPQVFTPDRLGRWAHLAVVYDRAEGRVTHYVDGRLIAEEPIKLDVPLHVGDAELGNWDVGPRRHNHPIRYFTGCMDEFLMFSRALGAAEVERLYLQGRAPL
jgi:hypothetical protein